MYFNGFLSILRVADSAGLAIISVDVHSCPQAFGTTSRSRNWLAQLLAQNVSLQLSGRTHKFLENYAKLHRKLVNRILDLAICWCLAEYRISQPQAIFCRDRRSGLFLRSIKPMVARHQIEAMGWYAEPLGYLLY